MEMQTYSGRMVDLVNPDPATIDIIDIAHHLSLINRFGGAVIRPYSVAEHCLRMVRCVERNRVDLLLATLLHDAGEAFLGDDTRPKQATIGESLAGAQRLFQAAVYDRFGLKRRPGDLWPEEVRFVDDWMLQFEASRLISGGFRSPLPEPVRPEGSYMAFSRPEDLWPGEFRCLHWYEAKRMFSQVFERLVRRDSNLTGLLP